MSNRQNLALTEIEDFLIHNFNDNILSLEQINGGERSEAFLFTSDQQKYVFRLNYHSEGFLKDQYAFINFSQYIPVPEIVQIGNFEDKYYAISKNCEGSPLKDDPFGLPAPLVSNLMAKLDQIRLISIPQENKFGVADINGIAEYETWDKWVLKDNTVVTKDDGSFYTWDEVRRIPFVDKNLIDDLFLQISQLVCFVPKEKYLIHGDFGTGNIIVNNNLISGIIDWNEFGYGDYLFDLAWLDFWMTNTDFVSAYLINHQNIPNFKERIHCHKLFIGLNTLRIYAAIGWQEGYQSTLEKIKNFYRQQS